MRSRVKERLQGDGNNTTQEIDEAINQVQDEEARKVEQDNTVRKWQEVDTVYRRLNSDQQAQVTAYHTATPEATPEDIHSYMGGFS